MCVVLNKEAIIFFMIRRPPRCTQGGSSAASDVYKGKLSKRADSAALALLLVAQPKGVATEVDTLS